MTFFKRHTTGGTAALCAAVLLFLLPCSCGKKKTDLIPNFEDRSAVPGMWLDSVTTLISDSGIIRYRVVTEKWDAFDKAADPYWHFPRGVYFERFNDTLVIESTVESDTAWYYYDRKLWILKQNVKVRNLSGETFETTLLNWDQDKHRVWSDTSYIQIRQENQIVTGHGFESNESMTRYTVREIEGMFPMDKQEGVSADSSTVVIPAARASSPRPKPAGRPASAAAKKSVAVPPSASSPVRQATDGMSGRKFEKKVVLSEGDAGDIR